MSNKKYQKHISYKEKQKFHHLLSEDEEIKLLAGFSAIYIRQKFIHFIILPCIIIILLSLFLIYLILPNQTNYSINPLVILFSGYFLAFFIAVIQTWILSKSTKYILTNKRVLIKKGFFNHKLYSAPFDKVTQIEIVQGLFDRLVFNHGKIRISIAGLDHKEIDLDYIDSPLQFKNILEQLIHIEQSVNYLRSENKFIPNR